MASEAVLTKSQNLTVAVEKHSCAMGGFPPSGVEAKGGCLSTVQPVENTSSTVSFHSIQLHALPPPDSSHPSTEPCPIVTGYEYRDYFSTDFGSGTFPYKSAWAAFSWDF
jgi:hypothetical protein